jgi:hypothetical protein
MPYFVGYILNSYMNLEEMTTPLVKYSESALRFILPVLFDGTKSGEEINEELTTNVAELFTENYRQNFKTDTTFTSLWLQWKTTVLQPGIPLFQRELFTALPTVLYLTVSVNIYRDFLATGKQTTAAFNGSHATRTLKVIPAVISSGGFWN